MKKNRFQKLVEKNIKKNVKELVESLKFELKDCSKNYLIVKCQGMTAECANYFYCQLKKYLPNKKIIFIPTDCEIDSWGDREFSEYIERLIKARRGELE